MSVLEDGLDLKHDQQRRLSTSHFTPCVSSLLCSKVWMPFFTTTAIFASHFGGGIGATLQEFSWTQDSSLCREFLDDARLALHDCREGKKEVVIKSVGNQQSLVWALSGLLVGLFVPIIWIVSARCLTRRRAKSESAPVEQDDKFGKAHVRLLVRAGVVAWLRNAVRAPMWLCATWMMRLITNASWFGLFPFCIGLSSHRMTIAESRLERAFRTQCCGVPRVL